MINRQNLDPRIGMAVTLGAAPRCYLGLSYQLVADSAGEFLMVASSFVSVCLDPELNDCLVHWDYERDKDGYPEAHVQIPATSQHWEVLLRRAAPHAKDNLGALHLPVGGRRFRPSLEDIIEFLVRERLVDARDGWAPALHDTRRDFQFRQLRAAIRREPHIAAEGLRRLGYKVTAPTD